MKKRIALLGVTLLLAGTLVGCSEKVEVDNTSPDTASNRFQLTGEYYFIGEYKYKVVKDTETSNLYLLNEYHQGWNSAVSSFTPLYDENGQIAKGK